LNAFGGGANGSREEPAIELGSVSVARPNDRAHAAGEEINQRERSRRKYRKLLEREAMKFSHSIQFNAVPEWTSHYINYSNLKKL
jgi:SPX domain